MKSDVRLQWLAGKARVRSAKSRLRPAWSHLGGTGLEPGTDRRQLVKEVGPFGRWYFPFHVESRVKAAEMEQHRHNRDELMTQPSGTEISALKLNGQVRAWSWKWEKVRDRTSRTNRTWLMEIDFVCKPEYVQMSDQCPCCHREWAPELNSTLVFFFAHLRITDDLFSLIFLFSFFKWTFVLIC